ncbi:MAG: hypothetical protein EZS28_040400, partial [Streblomastix strix]
SYAILLVKAVPGESSSLHLHKQILKPDSIAITLVMKNEWSDGPLSLVLVELVNQTIYLKKVGPVRKDMIIEIVEIVVFLGICQTPGMVIISMVLCNRYQLWNLLSGSDRCCEVLACLRVIQVLTTIYNQTFITNVIAIESGLRTCLCKWRLLDSPGTALTRRIAQDQQSLCDKEIAYSNFFLI